MIKKISRFVLSVCMCVGLVFPIVTEINKPIEVDASIIECLVYGPSSPKCMVSIVSYAVMTSGVAAKGTNVFEILVDDVVASAKDFVFDERYGVTKDFENKNVTLTKEGMTQLYKDIYSHVPLANKGALSSGQKYLYKENYSIAPSFYFTARNPYFTENTRFNYISKPTVYYYESHFGGTSFPILLDGHLSIKAEGYLGTNVEITAVKGVTSKKVYQSQTTVKENGITYSIFDYTFDLVYSPLEKDTSTAFGTVKAGTKVLYQITYDNINNTSSKNLVNPRYDDNSSFLMTEDNSFPDGTTFTPLETQLWFKTTVDEAIADLKFENEKFILQGLDLIDEKWQDFLKDMDLIHNQIWHETIPLPTPIPTSPPQPTEPTIKPPPFPFPTDFPQWETFPTSPPLDIGESIPLDPPNITSTDGTGSVTGDGLAGVLGDIGNWFSGVFSNIGKAIGSLGTGILDLLKWIGQSMITGFNNVMGFLGSLLQSILNGVMSIVDFCTTFFKELTAWLERALNIDLDFSSYWDNMQASYNDKFMALKQFTNLFSSIANRFTGFRCNACAVLPDVVWMDYKIVPSMSLCFSQFQGSLGALYTFYMFFMNILIPLSLVNHIFKRLRIMVERGWH